MTRSSFAAAGGGASRAAISVADVLDVGESVGLMDSEVAAADIVARMAEQAEAALRAAASSADMARRV